MTEITTRRDLTQIAAEIRYLDANAKRIVLGHAIEIGNRLIEAKQLVEYGQWGNWLKENLDYSQSSANNFMRIAQEYGAAQMGLFGPEADSQTLGNLPYTKALKLLAIPEEEREEFVEANDVEHMSTRELDKAIAEAKQEKEWAERKLNELNAQFEESQNAIIQRDMKLQDRDAEIYDLKSRVKELENRPVEVAVQVDQKAIDEAVKAAKEDARKKLTEANETINRVQKNADEAKKEANTAKKEQKSAETKLKEAETRLAAAEAQLEELKKAGSGAAEKAKTELEHIKAEAESLRKQLSMANNGVSSFKTLFNYVQDQFDYLIDALDEITEADAREKCKAAVLTMLQQNMEAVG